MGVFHVFKFVQIVPNRATHHIYVTRTSMFAHNYNIWIYCMGNTSQIAKLDMHRDFRCIKVRYWHSTSIGSYKKIHPLILREEVGWYYESLSSVLFRATGELSKNQNPVVTELTNLPFLSSSIWSCFEDLVTDTRSLSICKIGFWILASDEPSIKGNN